LVTGATGFAGSALLRRLCAEGAIVNAIARPVSSNEHLKDLPVTWFRGEVFDKATVEASSRGVEFIFHLASVYRKAVSSNELNRLVHVVSTQLLAQAVLGRPGFRRFVHVSTVGVHGHVEGRLADEDYRMNPGDIYQRTKAEAEVWFREFAAKSGLPFTVVRPVALYGPHETRLFKLFRMASRPVVVLLGRRGTRYHMIHIDDFVEVLVRAATHPAALDTTFIAGNPESIALEDFVRLVARELGRSPLIIRLPAWPVFLVAAAVEWVCRSILRVEPPLHRRRVAFFTKERCFNTARMRRILGYECRLSNEEGIVLTTRWYVDNGWLKKR
jgi:nucleoside-diphosphate-sugar epimerase